MLNQIFEIILGNLKLIIALNPLINVEQTDSRNGNNDCKAFMKKAHYNIPQGSSDIELK